jgi:hypothetical protein
MGFLRGVFFGHIWVSSERVFEGGTNGCVWKQNLKIGKILKYFRAEFKDDKRLYFKVVDCKYNCIKL